MSEEENQDDPDKKSLAKKSRLPLMIGLALAVIGGGGGYFAVSSGLILGETHGEETHAEEIVPVEPLNDIAFVALDPLVISLRSGSGASHLRFLAHLEVTGRYEADVTLLLPRVMDVLNNYLRAVKSEDFDEPGMLIKMRAQMLRRVQVVTGEGRVRDLLVSEFVLN